MNDQQKNGWYNGTYYDNEQVEWYWTCKELESQNKEDVDVTEEIIIWDNENEQEESENQELDQEEQDKENHESLEDEENR